MDIMSWFPFALGQLPIHYLWLPLLTRRMTVNDYMPLVEKIKKQMRSWTCRFLSHDGRLQLITYVITSLVNFLLAAFKLPCSYLKEIKKTFCSVFFLSCPELKMSKANVSWKDICLTKNEGCLSILPLKEINIVYCIKLIWRLFSLRSSLWVR